MGLFDNLLSDALGQLGQADNPLLRGAAHILANHDGGLDGLIHAFESKGLADVIGSWVGTEQNLPISADQLKSVLGNDKVADIAQSLGLSHGDALEQLRTSLPQLIDKLTPNGQVNGMAIEQALGALLRR
jgi:uncharacterized protein YidB (DUF937 family)